MKLTVTLAQGGYDIIVNRGTLGRVGRLVNLMGKVLIVTDDGVPTAYIDQMAAQCPRGAEVVLLARQEGVRSVDSWRRVVSRLQAGGFGSEDMVVALGGAAVGDVAGFAAACYHHGAPYCQLPTTVTAQAGAAVGGKTGIWLGGQEGEVGVFHQPVAVLADPELLASLPARSWASGMAEVLKTALVASRELFELLEKGQFEAEMERLLYLSLRCKKNLVERDPAAQKDQKLLGFGSVVGAALRKAGCTVGGAPLLLGESSALGLLPLVESRTLLRRIRAVMRQLGLPVGFEGDRQAVARQLVPPGYEVTRVKEAGKGYLEWVDAEELRLLFLTSGLYEEETRPTNGGCTNDNGG